MDHAEAGLASGIVNTAHELGGALGVAVMSTVAAGSLAGAVTDAAGFTNAFTMMAAIDVGAALAALALVPGGRSGTVSVRHGHAH